ncbi:hypothetical protein HBI38_193420 [Parastagonospora nodorum]|nr:hypothetical protein HBI77_211040 [Parastagonospora nodorum]KAH5074031.1 hypothetical protein HBI73_183220 [Parastagonospora nodorum]KAH5353797.1 hypothetical protein HBI33_208900 [Parastagonospora nodorum]KAH5402036.1 hypothetical protein HBI47_191920 [Parastagonospora nodorum]KAH6008641.1 hypothetical protein HBI83_173700 [Parastagonospora nodorum]
MNAVDAHAQPYDGQRRQQRHPQDASPQGYAPMSTTGNFFMPETQGTFTFSAEPSSMMYDGAMTTLPTSTTGQESVYTPHIGSSIDSSLHPDMVNYSYPPVNGYAQMHNYSLSPSSYNGNGQGISPSHSVEHLSPENGYMSDPSIQGLSTYATPNFNPQQIDDTLANFSISDNDQVTAFPSFNGSMDMSQLTSGTLNMFNAQPPMLSSNAPRELHHQLISPAITNNSSPIVGNDGSTFQPMHYPGAYHTSTPPNQHAQIPQSTPGTQMQSPALTNSPSNNATVNIKPLRRHLTSPIVRVEHYSRDDSPSRSDNSRPLSKRSHGSRPSASHLSPYPPDESTDEEEDVHEQVRVQPVVRSHERNEDGSWQTSHISRQAGINPGDRQAMGDAWVPSLGELVEQHAKQEKKLVVQEWLTKSEVGSEAGDTATGSDNLGSSNLLVPHAGRRRAKSTNDMHRHGPQSNFGLGVRTDFSQYNDASIPGPGVYIDERSEYNDYDDEDDESAAPESPAAAVDVRASQEDTSYFPPAKESVSIIGTIVKPWVDVPSQTSNASTRYQPPTSNAAMMRFRLRAKDVESASLAATVGSRRLSESDLGSVRAAPGVARLIEPDPKKSKERQRRPSFLDNILPKRAPANRAPANLLKRKGSIPVQQPSSETALDKTKEPIMEKPKRIGSWGRPKSPRVDTNLSNHSREGAPPSANGLSANNTGPWYHGARNVIKRSRSRSDIGKSPGLKELMTQHGGPPMPMLASPLADTEATKPTAQPSPAGDDNEDEPEAVQMDLQVRTDPIIPTYEGFRTHARRLNPRLADYMVERITQEQMRRYKRLLEFRVKHMNAVKNRNCASEGFCTDLGGEAKQLPPKAGNKDADATFIGFQVTAPGGSEEDGDPLPEGVVQANQFSSGIPLPPVKRLPAEFECTLCFKVKQFYKPSDWTKHVHEDVQPFTCTFPNCGEPKSFKRKADWVRHENERHRQLENWTCQIADCNHTCYRKDNFVQHLVREHKIAEPRQRTRQGSNKEAAAADQGSPFQVNISGITNSALEDIWSIVERCRRDTAKQPKDEPCRFCGNICTSWKKLTVHLAKHMEQISMPILTLVEQKQLNADSIISPVVEMPDSRKLSMNPNKSPVDNNPSRYIPNSNLAPGIDPYGQYPQDVKSETGSTGMHTYPPPQMLPYKGPQSNGVSGYADYAVNNGVPYPIQTYPGLQQPPKPLNGYANGLQIPSQPYANGQYGITPVTAVQQQQNMYTDSPIDQTAFPSYYTQEPQNLTNDATNMGFATTSGMQYQQQPQPQQGAYQAMPYMNPQHNYQYQGQ